MNVVFRRCYAIAGTVTRIVYMEEVNYSFEQLEEGNESALREYNVKQIEGLSNFVTLILGELTSNDRKKIVAIVTVDVHARDVVAKLIDRKFSQY